ncbi:MAG: Acyl-CoA dehydrogenase domain protein [Desulfotomaculum sp. 46_80]|nr:MAG: Acyl-CoA dehydrogenase domain protein [Desulfotomaculum sp. 46_80]
MIYERGEDIKLDFSLNTQQEMLKKTVRQFAEEEIAPLIDEMELNDQTPPELVRKMGEQGFFGVTVPLEYGGTGMGHVARVIMLEEIARISAAIAMSLQVLQIGVGMMMEMGTSEQKNRYFPALAQGKILITPAFTESSGGSDLEGMSTKVSDKGEYYSIDGRKVFITNSHIADVVIIVAKHEETKKFGAFLVEKGEKGFRPGRVEKKIGLFGCYNGEIILDNCQAPKQNLFGEKGRGLAVALRGISNYGRTGMAGSALGLMQASLEAAIKFAQERTLYGKAISNLAPIQFKIAEIYAELEASRLMAYYTAWLIEQGSKMSDTQAAATKFFTTEASLRCTRRTMDIYGAYGCIKDYPIERYYRDAQLLISADGTSDIKRIIVGRNLTSKKS